MKGVSFHVWQKSFFHRLGHCLGKTMEMDRRTVSRENLLFGRVKILLESSKKVSTTLSLWLDNLIASVDVEKDCEDKKLGGSSDGVCRVLVSGPHREDIFQNSNFENPTSMDKFESMFVDRMCLLGPNEDVDLGSGCALDLGFEIQSDCYSRPCEEILGVFLESKAD